MNTPQILGVGLLAAALGAFAGGAVAALGTSAPTAGDSAVLTRLDELARRIDTLRESAQAGRDGVADLQERLVAVQLELGRRPTTRTAASPGPAGDAVTTGSAPTRAGRSPVILGHTAIADMEAQGHDLQLTAEAATARAQALQQRFAKALELRALPEDERWARIADELGLNSVQVDELKAAQTALQDAMKAAVTEEEKTTDAGAAITFRRVDGEKMQEARKTFDDRVGTLLNDQQKKAWADGGYDRAVGGGRSMVFRGGVRMTTGGGDSPGTGTIIIATDSSDR